MGFVAVMLLIVFALLTALSLLAAGTSDRFHRGLDIAPWQLIVGLVGVAAALPMVIAAGQGPFLLGLSVYNVVAGGHSFWRARRQRRARKVAGS